MFQKKILITWWNGMLAYDFISTQSKKYQIIALDKQECDIRIFPMILQAIAHYEPDIVLNCAAYTDVDSAEDEGSLMNYEVNTLWLYNLGKATWAFGLPLYTLSTDYVFDGNSKLGYWEQAIPNPSNAYGMAKYLWEKLALDQNSQTKIIRTSWLYWGASYHKNFVYTIHRLLDEWDSIPVVDDQYWIPTSCKDLSYAISRLIDNESDEQVFHFVSQCQTQGVTWAEFAEEITTFFWIHQRIKRIPSSEFPRKARRPKSSVLKNTSDILLPDWKVWLHDFLRLNDKALSFSHN